MRKPPRAVIGCVQVLQAICFNHRLRWRFLECDGNYDGIRVEDSRVVYDDVKAGCSGDKSCDGLALDLFFVGKKCIRMHIADV
jgi:hypothetical protein